MRENSILKERIMQVLDFKRIKRNKFYIETGISNGILSQSNGLSEDNLLRFLNFYPDVNPEWLLTGNGEMLKSKSKENVTILKGDKKGDEKGDKPNVQKMSPFKDETPIAGMVAEERAGYGSSLKEIEMLKERLQEQKDLYTGQIQFLTNQIESLNKDKDERIQEYRDRIRELKGYIETLKNVSPLDDSQKGVG